MITPKTKNLRRIGALAAVPESEMEWARANVTKKIEKGADR